MAGMAALIIVAYLAYAVRMRREVPPSISQTAYDMRYKWTWTVVFGMEAWLIAPAFVEQTSEDTKFIAFLTVAAIGVLAMTPLWMKERNMLHNVAGIAACVFSQLAIALNLPEILLTWIAFGVMMAYKQCRWRWCFIAEAFCLANVIMFCIIK